MSDLTITWDQVGFIWSKVHEWREIVRQEKGEYPDLNNIANMSKSCLLGRMLIEGKDPLPEPPPKLAAAPWYWFVEEHGNTDHNRHVFTDIINPPWQIVMCLDCDRQVVWQGELKYLGPL